MARWAWDQAVRRYRDLDTGRYLPREAILGYVQRSLDASGNAMDDLAGFIGQQQLSPADFGLLAKEELKQEYIRQYLLGIGGREQMKPADWGSVGGMLKEQYRYFNDFLREVEAGNLSEAQIRSRLRMYTNSAREAYERAHMKNAKALGMDEEQWILDAEAEHCDDCVMYAGMGWQPIGTFPQPGDGSTQCLTNCACGKSYRNSKSGESY